MHFKTLFIFILLFSYACNNNAGKPANENSPHSFTGADTSNENPYRHISDIPLPGGFERVAADPGTFGAWLRNRELKKNKTVYLYNGQPKYNQTAQFAVLDISTGDKDLQQCADAVMRLRAEYFFEKKAFDSIVFFDNNSTAYHFSPPYNRENFSIYLSRVFGMCGTASLSKQLKHVGSISEIKIGDVLIRGGSPGHAVIVMDEATDGSGRKIYMLAQGYMPAQDIHVLKNPLYGFLSPWYLVNDRPLIQTPEYTFYATELKRW